MNRSLEDDEVKLEVLRLRADGHSSADITRITGIPNTTIRDFLKGRTHKDFYESGKANVAAGDHKSHHSDMEELRGGRYIFTAAQNNSYVHSGFLRSLENCSEDLKAEIIVGTFTYNTNGFFKPDGGYWYDPKIVKYRRDEPLKVAEGLIWCGEMDISPTAVNPMSGLQSYTQQSSSIFPHVKVQTECVPTAKHLEAKVMHTTGAVTKRNYIPKKAGQKGSFHHSYAALLVEVDRDGTWFVWNLIADSETGSFQHLDTVYTATGVERGVDLLGINYGDIHAEKKDKVACELSFGKGQSMLNILRPKEQFVHDVLDFSTRNHHNIKDIYFRFAQQVQGSDKVEDDINSVVEVLKEMSRDYCKTIVVESNHNLAMTKWLQNADYRNENIDNALFCGKCQYWVVDAIRRGHKNYNVFEESVREKLPDLEMTFLVEDESYVIAGDIECGSHGDRGANGARGSKLTFARAGTRYNIGHCHSPYIYEGTYAAGTLSNLDLGYNKGLSSWHHCNILTYQNGKRTLAFIKNGKWRAEKLRGTKK